MPTEDYLEPDPPGRAERRLTTLENERDEALAKLEEAEAALRRRRWICFHCCFETTDPDEARGHFGTRRSDLPLCQLWGRMDDQARATALQTAYAEVEMLRDKVKGLQEQVDGLEYRLGSQEADISCRFRGCKTIQDVFNKYDSMHGRALAAEDRLRTVAQWIAEPTEFLQRWRELQVLSNQALLVTRMQARIGAWGDSCPAVQKENTKIGRIEHPAIYAALDKLVEEVDELRGEMIQWEDFNRELADCAIVIFRIAHLKGFDLLAAIEDKMLANVAKHGGVWMDREGKEHSK